jgi:hypothetical protein
MRFPSDARVGGAPTALACPADAGADSVS